ncbi:MAG: HAD-IIB family hydrolase [Proteobacteria bacterium]|nr:HAD-IIB family hydrolase [Pseudomonadota bacterium]NIS72320.1 HAD-IIB family hydrolase [Pseudomonadota bacterium]
MIPSIDKLPPETAKNLLGIFFDLDDTFTTRGKIPSVAYQALWALKESDLRVVPITGRPAGWCDHIARMWPVDGVVGENGALYFWYDEPEGKLKKRFLDPEPVRAEKRNRLEAIRDEILASVPGTAIASDQRYRESDLAIDYCEDVKPLDRGAVDRICRIFKKHGATCKVASIHVNGWFGNYDKLAMTKIFVQEQWRVDLDADKTRFLFCGDSPNDEPMFRYFPYAVGVRNVLPFADQMKHLPTFVANREGGEGFAEIAKIILEQKDKIVKETIDK